MLAGVPDLRLGELVDWSSAPTPSGKPLRRDNLLLRPVDPAVDAEPSYSASHPTTGDPGIWTYLPDGPHESPQHLQLGHILSPSNFDAGGTRKRSLAELIAAPKEGGCP